MRVTCEAEGGGVAAAHAAVLLRRRQGFQDDVRGAEARQRDVGQVGQRVLLGKQLAGFPPLAQEPPLGEEHYPLPVAAVVVLVQVLFQVDQLLVSVSFTLRGNGGGGVM